MESGFCGKEACMHLTRGLKVEGRVKTEGGALGMSLEPKTGHGDFENMEDFMTKFAASITDSCV